MEKILLAVDGSAACDKAVKKTLELVDEMDAEVTVLTVMEKNITPLSDSSEDRENKYPDDDEYVAKAKSIAHDCASVFEGRAKKLNRIVEAGSPAEIICEEAENGEYDFVVLSDMGKHALKRFFLGSTTEKVVRHCNTSVMVVK